MQQDQAAAFQLGPPAKPAEPPSEPPLKCPRCESTDTKFCYYNNYNLSQPRHFCKSCRRYWTKGGALRNIPIGGASRKNSKRSSPSTSSSSPPPPPKRSDPGPKPLLMPEPVSALYPPPEDNKMMEITGSFSSLLHSSGQFGNFLDGFDSVGAPESDAENPNPNPNPNPNLLLWPDLSIYTTPGSAFQ